MSQETQKLKKVELQYCVECPTCNEIFKVKPPERTFIQTCVFCRDSFQVVVKEEKEKSKAFAFTN
jgi:hypothetical protein